MKLELNEEEISMLNVILLRAGDQDITNWFEEEKVSYDSLYNGADSKGKEVVLQVYDSLCKKIEDAIEIQKTRE